MLFFPIITTTLLSSLAVAMPTTSKRLSFENVEVIFTGAAGASYTMVVSTDNVAVPTNNDLSITSVGMFGRADFLCTFFGIDGSHLQLVADLVKNSCLI